MSVNDPPSVAVAATTTTEEGNTPDSNLRTFQFTILMIQFDPRWRLSSREISGRAIPERGRMRGRAFEVPREMLRN